MDDIKNILMNYLNTHSPKDLAATFESYMKTVGATKEGRFHTYKVSGRSSDKVSVSRRNSYRVNGDSENWNRVECKYYEEDDMTYQNESLVIVMRKTRGYYLLIESHGERIFDTDGSEVLFCKEEKLPILVSHYEKLFEMMK